MPTSLNPNFEKWCKHCQNFGKYHACSKGRLCTKFKRKVQMVKKICNKCLKLVDVQSKICPECGYRFKKES